jgi:ABC-type sugar transport system ATPase subunit
VTAALERLGIPAGPEQMAADLSPAERAMVSLAFALDDIDDGGVEVLVLDEVTAHIPESEAMAFLELVRRVPELGVPVLMVTHRFKEVLTFADRATVLSDGRVVHRGPAKDLGFEELVGYMTAARTGLAATAAEVADEEAAAAAISVEGLRDLWRRDVAPVDPEEPILELVDVSGVQLDGVGFVLRPGEIVGVAGLPESGIGELPTILAGATPRAGGTIRLAGEELPRSLTPAEAIAAGLLSVPRDRHAEGGAASLTLAENMTLPEASRFWHRGRRERGIVGRFLDGFDVRPPRADALFGTLSGGNQQKVVIAKWMIAKPRVLVLDNPTAGVDPAARRQLFEIFHEAAADGLALLVFSSEPEQFAEHCSRVLVLGHGRITGELAAESLAAETINQKVTSLSS